MFGVLVIGVMIMGKTVILFNQVTRQQSKNQRAGQNATFNYALCQVLEVRLGRVEQGMHDIKTKSDVE